MNSKHIVPVIKSVESWCNRCNRTGKITVDMAMFSTDNSGFGTSNTHQERVCPECGGKEKFKVVTETRTWTEPTKD